MFGILRSDGKWYCGTVDREASWEAELANSGCFSSEEAAHVRRAGLQEEDEEHTFEVIPVTG
jgi:hypothetical protein